MKKHVLFALILLLALVLAGCGDEPCQHSYDPKGFCDLCGDKAPDFGDRSIQHGPFTLQPSAEGYRIIAFDQSKLDGVEVLIPSTIDGTPVVAIYSEGEKGAFEGADRIESVIIPESVTSIRANSFKGCTALKKISSHNFAGFTSWFDYNLPQSLTEIVIAGGTYVGPEQFKNCEFIQSVTIPASVTSVGFYAFEGCTQLQKIYYNGTLANWCGIEFEFSTSHPMQYATEFYLLENGEYTLLTNAVISEGAKEIKQYAFFNFNFESIILPQSLETIGNDAFDGCNELKTVWYEGSAIDFMNVSISSSSNHCLTEAATYYYDEESTVFDYLSGKITWHYNDQNQPELWSFNVTDTVSGKTYAYESTQVVVSDEYWSMLQQAKAQGMLDQVLDAETLSIYNNSIDKESFQIGLRNNFQNAYLNKLTVKFADGKVAQYLDQQTTSIPLEYVEVDSSNVYYTLSEKLAYTITDGKICEDLSNEYVTVIHFYQQIA